jgi:Sigma-70 region 2
MDATACYFVNGMESETSAIARGLRRRDPDLLDRLIEQYQHRRLGYLVSLTADRAIAEDLFQETWMRVLERGHQYDGPARVQHLAVQDRQEPHHESSASLSASKADCWPLSAQVIEAPRIDLQEEAPV